jgi:hypothetical protein
MEVITRGIIAILSSLRKISARGSVYGIAGSPITSPAKIPRKKPTKMKIVRLYFLRKTIPVPAFFPQTYEKRLTYHSNNGCSES